MSFNPGPTILAQNLNKMFSRTKILETKIPLWTFREKDKTSHQKALFLTNAVIWKNHLRFEALSYFCSFCCCVEFVSCPHHQTCSRRWVSKRKSASTYSSRTQSTIPQADCEIRHPDIFQTGAASTFSRR